LGSTDACGDVEKDRACRICDLCGLYTHAIDSSAAGERFYLPASLAPTKIEAWLPPCHSTCCSSWRWHFRCPLWLRALSMSSLRLQSKRRAGRWGTLPRQKFRLAWRTMRLADDWARCARRRVVAF